jgi:hypothetical protein
MLNGFDEVERKYYEKGSKTLHTRERCEAAKLGKVESTSQGQPKSRELTELITKVDQLIVMVQDLQQKISGQTSLDLEQ